MTQQLTQKAVNTFIRGLITERNELTFPEGASVDELNCVLLKDGSRRRRLGIEKEDVTIDTAGIKSHTNGLLSSVNYWFNVGGEPGLDYIIVQSGKTLAFYVHGLADTADQRVLSEPNTSSWYSVDLETYDAGSLEGVGNEPIQATSINGGVVIASPEINTFYITRDQTTGTFTETQISFRIRDFTWQGDKSTYYEDASSPSVARQYDTKNTGWAGTLGAAALSAYQTANSNDYPALNQPWWSGKGGGGSFDAAEWAKVDGGTSLIANGRFVYDLYNIDRSTNQSGLSDETESTRFSTVATYAGRVFYAGMTSSKNSSRIYFSQVDPDISYVGECLQANDPTNEYFSDLLDTDGGFINIPEAHNIKKLHPFGTKLYVFAENGVWSIGGVDDIFRATDYSVNKIANTGLGPKGSFIAGVGRPFWWSTSGIHTIVIDEVGNIQVENLSLNTIQTFFESIPTQVRADVRGGYDRFNRRVYWAYSNSDETIDGKLNKILVFDEALQAFYPWEITDQSPVVLGTPLNATSYILGVIDAENRGRSTNEEPVLDENENIVTTEDEETEVVADVTSEAFIDDPKIKFLVRDLNLGGLNFATASSTTFLDWDDDEDSAYTSYAVAGYDFMGDLTTQKSAVYVNVYLKRTETGFVSSGGSYVADRPSSCIVKAYWDFRSNPASSQEAYRLKYPVIVDPDDLTTFNYPESVVDTKLKVRGRGRVMNLRFENSGANDFHLLGWEVIGGKNARL